MQNYKDEFRAKKRKKIVFQSILFLIVCITSSASFVYLLFFIKLFDVRSVTVDVPDGLRLDVKSTVDGWLDSGFWKLTRRNNILFFKADELVSQLSKQFPKLEPIVIAKDLPHALIISANERRPVGIWCLVSEECFYFDKSGVAFSRAQPSTGFLLLNVNDRRPRELKLGEKVIAEDWLTNITKAKELLAKIDINISEFVIPADLFDEFYVKTAEDWRILFSNSTDIARQIISLGVLFKDKLLAEKRAGLQYIDLRIQDRIYYK